MKLAIGLSITMVAWHKKKKIISTVNYEDYPYLKGLFLTET